MSLAGARSSLGDYYQNCVALQYAVPLLLGTGPFQSIEVEVTSLDDEGNLILVDDIVLHRKSGHTRYVQCKKNSPDHGEWTVAQLRPDLLKAAIQLAQDPTGEVEFHSRSGFGRLFSLRERLDTFPTLAAFEKDIPDSLAKVFESFVGIWVEAIPDCTRSQVHDSLRRIGYSSPLDLHQIHEYCRSSLIAAYANPESAIDSLLGILTQAASKQCGLGRVQGKHPFTATDLRERLFESGFNRSPNQSEAEILEAFRRASCSGRAWPRTIAGHALKRSVQGELQNAIQQGDRSILVTDEPGSGKTCLLLGLVESLENEGHVGVLFIQGREYEACDDEAALVREGIPKDLPGLVERLSNYRPVVVVIDSLDVLALARNHRPLQLLLRLFDRLVRLENVTVVVACRTFDLKNEPRLTERTWGRVIHIGPLSWETEIVPLFVAWGVDTSLISSSFRCLLTNPRNLALFAKIIESGPLDGISTEQELADEFLDRVVLKDPALGPDALGFLTDISGRMLSRRRTKLLEAEAGVPLHLLEPLLSAEILIHPRPREVAFGHQTLIDVLAIRAALGRGGNLLSFLKAHAPVPFIRPSVRSFYLFLWANDPEEASKQLRVALENPGVAFHLKRLLVESWAEKAPIPTDIGLVRLLYRMYKPLFRILLSRVKDPSWLELLNSAWWARAVLNRDSEMLSQYLWMLRSFAQSAPLQVLATWHRFMALDFLDRDQVAGVIAISMQEFDSWTAKGVQELLELLVSSQRPDHDFVGRALAKFISRTGTGDELLWRYIVHDSDSDDSGHRSFDWNLHCGPNTFEDHGFLSQRLEVSETLLDLAIGAMEQRTRKAAPKWEPGSPHIGFLMGHSTWRYVHHEVEHQHADGCTCLLEAIEKACVSHAGRNTDWWQVHESMLASACEGALRYIHLKSCTAHPEGNLVRIQGILTSGELFDGSLHFEIACLIRASFASLDSEAQEIAQKRILDIGKDAGPEEEAWPLGLRRDLLVAIPAHLRTAEAQELIDYMDRHSIQVPGLPRITTWCGSVGPTCTAEELSGLSDDGLVTLLLYLDANQDDSPRERFSSRDLSHPLQRMAMQDPERAMGFIEHHATRVSLFCLTNLTEGIGRHLQMRCGSLIEQGLNITKKSDEKELSQFLLATLERHPIHWLGHSSAPEILLGVSTYVDSGVDAERAAIQLWSLSGNSDPSTERIDSDPISVALNSVRGRAAMAAIQIANHLLESGTDLPIILTALLQRFASDPHPAVRGAIIHGLPFTQSKSPLFGWDLFNRSLARPTPELWREAERCLYFAYRRSFERVRPCLDRIKEEGFPAAGGTWGRISALACLSGCLTMDTLFEMLSNIAVPEVWEGVLQVFAGNIGLTDCYDTCVVALRRLLPLRPQDTKVGHHLGEMFSLNPLPAQIPKDLIQAFLDLKGPERPSTYSFMKWAKHLAEEDCHQALDAMEILTQSSVAGSIHDHESLTAILTTLMREGEIQEALDHGVFLNRALQVQDRLMELNVFGIDEWLAAAERP